MVTVRSVLGFFARAAFCWAVSLFFGANAGSSPGSVAVGASSSVVVMATPR